MTAALSDPTAEETVGGNVYPKYTTRNPIARHLVGNFMRSLHQLVRQSGATTVHEIGCGEGFLATALAATRLRVRGSDLSANAIAQARVRATEFGLEIPFRVASLYDLAPETDAAELVLCCEVLEHVPDPERALAVLTALARPHLIVSVPREPLWRVLNVARGRYLRDLGNTPGHVQHWSRSGFRRLVERHAEVVAVRSPVPWTMLLCRAR